MDAAYLSRALDDLAGCARKEKKLKLEKALFVFQKSEVIVTVDLNSELKHLDRTCHVFTWNSCLQIVLKILMNEIQVACRTSKGEPNMNAELQRYFKLLVLVASHGSHGNLVLDLNDLVASFLTVMKEPTLCFVRLPFFRALQWLFQRCASHSISFLSTHWDELIFWCCGQWNDFIDYNSPHLLCLILSHAITTHSVSWDYIWKSVTEFLRRYSSAGRSKKPVQLIHLGWFFHLLRWLVANVYATHSHWKQIASLTVACLPGWLDTLRENRALRLGETTDDVDLEFSPELFSIHHLQDSSWITSITPRQSGLVPLFDPWASLTSFNGPSIHLRHSLGKTEPRFFCASPGLVYPPSMFLVEPFPCLCSTPLSPKPMLAPEELSTKEECFSLCRWLLSQDVPLRSATCLVQYVIQEWQFVSNAIQFQQETTRWKQIRTLRNFFGLVAAVILSTYDQPSDPTSFEVRTLQRLLESSLDSSHDSGSMQMASSTKRRRLASSTEDRDSTSTCGTVKAAFEFLLSSNRKDGCLWWLVLDWTVRLKWQRMVSAHPENSTHSMFPWLHDLLDVAVPYMNVMKTPIDQECMLTAAHTLITVLRHQMERSSTAMKSTAAATITTTTTTAVASKICSVLDFSNTLHALWTSVIQLADPRPSWPDPSYDAGPDNTSLSKTAAHNLDRLAYEVLTELVLFSKSAERLEWATQLRSRFISDVERLLCREAWPIQSLPMRIHLPSWRVRFLLVTGLVLRECHLCSLSNYVPDWPLGLRTNPSLAFFVYQYVNEKHRVLSLMSEDQSKWGPLDNLSTLLTGLYWSSNFVLSRSCASSEQLLAPSCCLSDQQSCETIDFLLNMLHDTPKPKSNSGEFAFKRLRTHLDLVRLQLERLRADRAPQSILAALNVPTSSNLHQLLTATWDRLIPVLSKPVLRPDLHNLRCAMQLLLEYATRRDRLQSEQINQFMSILHRAVPSSLRKESSTPHPVDDTYYPLVCTDLYDLRIDGGGHRSIIGLDAKRDQLLHLNRLELFGSLLRFASRTGDSELITHMQKALADEISQGSCGDTVESVEWYCVLIRMVHRAFSSINPVDFCGMEEVYTTFVSFLVDTLREAFKSRLARGSSLPNVVHLIYLMQTYCQLVDCVCLLVERVKSKFPSRHWSVIGCHLDQLCKTVWAICARRSSGFLVGLEFCSGECLHAWMKLRAFELTDRDSTPDHCLNSLLYYRSAPAVLLRFTEFLQNLASKLEDANWNRKHAAAVLQLIDSVLRLLSVRQLRIEPPEEMEVGATADECPDQFALCLCSYRLLLTCLVRLPDLPPATDTKVELGENLSIGRPRVEHLAELCAQLIKCVPGPSAPVYGTQCASVNALLLEYLAIDEEDFVTHVRPNLLVTVLSRYVTQDAVQSPDSILTALRNFPWPCVGLSNYTEACSNLGSELTLFFVFHLGEHYESLESSGMNLQPNLVTLLAASVVADRLTNGTQSGLKSLNELIGYFREALPSISQNPVQLVRVIEQILRSIAFHHPNVQCDKRRVCSINPLFYSCLASLASLVDPSCAPNVSINQGSLEQRNVQAAKELFSSTADFTSLVEQLFALGATLAPKSDAPDVHTSLIMPHCMRFASWIALSDLIAQCVFDVNFPQPCPMQLKDFVFWRLIIGHLTLLTAELQSEFLHILEILASLKRILTISQCHIDPSRDIQMETSLHHSLVAHLVWTALITFQHPEPKSLWGVTVRKQVSEALMLLISQERFQKAVCELPSFPRSDRITHGFIVETLYEEMNSYFASFQTELEIVCSCQRTPLVQEIILLTRYFDPIEIHRCVTSRRFQGPILMALNRRLSDYLALNPCSIDELESRISQCGQVDHPSLIKDENSPELILSATLLIGQLQDLLQPASSSRQLSVESVLIGSMDTVTYEAGLLCLDSLQRLLTFGRSVSPSPPSLRRGILDHILYDDLDPQVVRIWQCLIYLGQSAANCVSSESLFSAQVLHNTSRHCGLSLTSLLAPIEENENFLADTSLHCILWPYLSSVDRKKNLVVLDPEKNCAHQRIACMNSEDQFIAEWNELLLACASPTHSPSDILVSMSNLILWWVNLPVILNPICLCLKPALRKSPSLYYDIFPWLVVTALTQDNTFGRDCSLSFSRALVKCVQLGMLNEQVDSGVRHLFLDALMSFHHWKQWKTLRCTKSAMAIDVTVDWLQAAQCAITLCRPNDARLCFELAWLHQGCPSDWFISTPEAREMWLGLSRLSCDLPGLQAAQIEFLSSDSTPIMSTTVATLKPLSLIDQAKLAANELLGDWGRLLVYHDRLLQTDRSYFLNPQIARCLNQMGARNLLTQLVLSDLRRMDSFDPRADSGISEPGLRGSDVSEIQEMRVAIAWRLGQWESYGASNSSSSHCSIPVYDTDQLELPTCSWSECGSQTVFYWLCRAADRADWAHVLTILSQQRTRYLCLKNGTSRRGTALPVHDILMSSQQFACVTALQRMCSRIVKLYQSNERSTTLASKILPMLCQVADYTNCSSNESPLTRGGKRVQRQLLCDATQSSEPLATVTLRLITSMLSTRNSQLRNSEGPFSERARLFGLVRLIRLLTVSFAVKTGAVQQAEDLLVDASRSPGFADLANLVDGSKPDVCRVTQCWYQLRTVELSALIERVRGEYCVATSHLQIALQDAEKVLSGLPTACPVSLTQGLVRCYLHGVTTLCNWLFESRTKSAADLLTNHLEPAIQLAKRLAIGVDANAWASLARFADAQFTALDSYLSSSEFAARRQLLVEAQSDVTCLTDLGEKSRLLRMLQRQSAIELEEMETIQSDADRYMQLAVDSYAHCLSSSDTYDLKIYRFVSLWLSASADPNQQLHPNTRALTTNRIMAGCLPGIRSDKFLNLVPQLAVRLSSLYSMSTPSFQSTLTQLVKRLIDEHPHHTAFTLLFLVNAKLDNVYNPHPTGQSLASAAPRSSASRARGGRGSGIQTEVLDGGQTGSEENGRILAARRIFDQLSQGRQGKLLRQMQLLAEAYVEWANADVEKYRNRPGDVPLPADCKLSRFVVSARARGASSGPSDLLDLVAVPTVNLAVNRSGLYPPSSVVRVTGFVPQFRLAGGINVPKIITCLGTDGRQRRQLIKGRDDPRQDAVMQQVFSAANCLLERGRRESTDLGSTDNSTFSIHKQSWLYSDGGLRMRTYKVLPMAERSGVIEWCEGTIPLGEWLAADRVGAHQRYRPRDMTPAEAKQRLAAVRDRPPERRRVVFEEIMGRLKPVMAYFYLEQFPDSRGWCLARSAYTRSLAVSSLVGYLVGLGDRHPQNILLHQGSGELVHIDLGVAFDQGRLLPTPEMVPFRLTRDLVHALGPLGLQAGFTPAAEVVLAALRTGSDVILTLLQVLLHDPLYSWSLSPAQLCALEARRAELLQTSGFQASKSSCGTILLDQTNFPGDNVKDKDRLNVTKTILGSTTSVLNTTFTGRTGPGKTREPVNQLAERVLIGVRSKLEGRVTGNLASSSDGNPARCGGLDQLDVAGHVGLLVRAATDPANLSRMYFGWQAYL